jgi:excisionase family DNA binding protein
MAEAAQRLGISAATVKRKLRRGELQGYQEPRPQGFTWLVDFTEVQASCSRGALTGEGTHTSTETMKGSTAEVHRLEELVSLLRTELEATRQELHQQLEAKDKQLEARAREVQELHVLLQRAQAALPAPKEDRQSWWHRLWQRQR